MAASVHTWSLPEEVCLQRGLAAVRGRVFILYHPKAPSLARARREGEAFVRLRAHFESVSIMIWEGQPFPPPPTEVRQSYAEHFARGPSIDAVAWIVDSRRSMGASIVSSLSTQLFPRGAKTKVFREPFEAATWLTSFEDGGAGVEDIIDGLDTLDRSVPEV